MIWRDRDVAVKVGRRRKTMHIVVERDGSLSVQVPENTGEDKITEVLDRRAYSIFRLLQKWKETHVEHPAKTLSSGMALLYRGKSCVLRFVENLERDVVLKDGELLIHKGVENPEKALLRFYFGVARDVIPKRLSVMASRIGVAPTGVRVRDMRTRWGSCTPRGVITINWRAVMAPLRIMDYIIVHELLHLRYHRHSRRFWEALGLALPGYDKSIEWLRRNGVRLELLNNKVG